MTSKPSDNGAPQANSEDATTPQPAPQQPVNNPNEMSAGQRAVGATFNPSQDEKVSKLKQLFAEAFDIVEGCVAANDGTNKTARERKMRDAALHEIITAQMWAVKVATLHLQK